MLKEIDTDVLCATRKPFLEEIEQLKMKVSKLEDELLQEKIKNSDLEERLKKAKEMLPSWQSMQI